MNLENLKSYELNSCLDIGAHVGNFYREAKQKLNVRDWLLIEANKNCESQLSELGVPYKICLLSDAKKELTYYRNKHDQTCTGNSYYRELTHHYSDENIETEVITSVTLDSVVGEKIYDLIKLDTQGSEIDILRGGQNTLRNARLVIIETSIQPYNRDAPLQPDVISFMKLFGFNILTIVGEVPHTHQQDILFINTART